jgi:hypothetical protein
VSENYLTAEPWHRLASTFMERGNLECRGRVADFEDARRQAMVD